MAADLEAERQLNLPVAAGDEPQEETPTQEPVETDSASPPSPPESSESGLATDSEASSPPPSPPSWREQAGQYGLDLSSYETDEAALQHLAAQAKVTQDQQALAQYGQEFVKHAADGSWQQYQEWKAQQAQPQAPAEPKLWDPPEWNPNWLTQVRQDDDGNLVPDTSRGGNPETVAKVQRYLQFRQDQQEKFWSDPYSFMKPYVEQLAEEKAKGLVEGELTKYGEQIDARHFITNNKNWLYKQDDVGQIAYENNQPVLSEDGQVFFNALRRVDSKQWSAADKQEYAMEALYNHRQLQGIKAQQAPPSAEQKKEEQLTKAAGFVPQASGSMTQSPDASGTETPQNANMTFREMLQAEFKAAGIEPSDDLVTA
jgi:hypothetical protein